MKIGESAKSIVTDLGVQMEETKERNEGWWIIHNYNILIFVKMMEDLVGLIGPTILIYFLPRYAICINCKSCKRSSVEKICLNNSVLKFVLQWPECLYPSKFMCGT